MADEDPEAPVEPVAPAMRELTYAERAAAEAAAYVEKLESEQTDLRASRDAINTRLKTIETELRGARRVAGATSPRGRAAASA